MEQKIELTPQEIEDIKDTATFRAKVMVELKRLCHIPSKVTALETKVLIYGSLTLLLLAGMLTLGLRVMANGGPK